MFSKQLFFVLSLDKIQGSLSNDPMVNIKKYWFSVLKCFELNQNLE